MNKIRLVHDSRDKHFYQHFGQATEFPLEVNYDSTQYDDVQPIGDVRCTCYTTCDIAEDQENRVFDIQDLWNRIPQSQFGADPRDVLGKAISTKEDGGLLAIGETVRRRDWKSYWSALSGDKDSFDNVRSALMIAKSPIGVASYWYSNWFNSDILPIGQNATNGHMYAVEGWKQINGEPMLIIEAWIGRKLYMSRAVFNATMKPYGMGAWVLSTMEIDEKIKLNILEKIKDACINVIILLKQLLIVKSTPVEKPLPPVVDNSYNEVKEAIKTNMIEKWAKAIARMEGDISGVNPGNLKYSPLIATWGATKGRKGSDGGNFAVFKSYDEGFKALCNFLTLGCQDKLKSYHNARTLQKFSEIYAGRPPQGYINSIAKELGVSLDVDISSFLS